MDNQSNQHTRHHNSLLASAEKRALVWMARRIPSWINSDHLTLLGLAGMCLAGISYWAARWDDRALFAVVVALVVNWLGDSLDGTLARVRKSERPRYGYYIDHVTDIFGVAFLLSGLAGSDYMSPVVALGFLAAFLMVSAEVYLATYSVGIFRLSIFRVGPTEGRILLIIGTLQLLYHPVVGLGNLGSFRLFDVGGVIGITILLLILLVSVTRNALTLHRLERKP